MVVAEPLTRAVFVERARFGVIKGCDMSGSLREGQKTVNETLAGAIDSHKVSRMIRTFQGIKPTVPKSCFIETTAVVIGDVVMGKTAVSGSTP